MTAQAAIGRGVAAIIPAWNEEKTIANVVRTVTSSPWIDEVMVVDNLSRDSTAVEAARAGARLVTGPVPGKGQAMAAGVAATDAPYVVFIDADLTGFTTDHIAQLVRPVVEGRTQMTRGLFDKGPLTMVRNKVLPTLTGERAMPREFFEKLKAGDVEGWRVEASMNRLAAREGFEPETFILHGMSHLEKREKYGNALQGMIDNQKALAKTVGAQISFNTRRLSGESARERSAVDAARAAALLGHAPVDWDAVKYLPGS